MAGIQLLEDALFEDVSLDEVILKLASNLSDDVYATVDKSLRYKHPDVPKGLPSNKVPTIHFSLSG